MKPSVESLEYTIEKLLKSLENLDHSVRVNYSDFQLYKERMELDRHGQRDLIAPTVIRCRSKFLTACDDYARILKEFTELTEDKMAKQILFRWKISGRISGKF